MCINNNFLESCAIKITPNQTTKIIGVYRQFDKTLMHIKL